MYRNCNYQKDFISFVKLRGKGNNKLMYVIFDTTCNTLRPSTNDSYVAISD